VTRCAAFGFQFVHPAALNFGRLLSRLLDLQPDGVALAQAQKVGEARKLVRAAVNLDGLPAQRFGYPNNRGVDG